MNKKGPRRYNSCNDIRDAIDLYKAKAQKLRESAAALDMKACEFAKAGPEFAEDLAYHREQAKKRRKSAQRIEEKTLNKLKNKMSEFQTNPIPGILPDRSIPVK